MEIIGFGFMAIGVVALCGLFAYFAMFLFRIKEMLEWFEDEHYLLYELLDWYENLPEAEPEKPAKPGNILEFPRKVENIEVAPPEKEEKEFWNDLAALEAEQQNIQNGSSNMAVSDSLDHVRAVATRIAELRELDAPPSKMPAA